MSASYQQVDQTTTTSQSLDQTVKHTIEAVSGNAEFAITAKTRIGFTPSYDYAEFPGGWIVRAAGRGQVPVDLYYSVTPKTALSVGYAYDRTTTEFDTGNAKGDFVNIGARGEFTPKLSGQVRVGVTELKPEQGQSTRQLGVESSLVYAYSPRTNFSLFADNGFAPSAAGNQTELFTAGVSGNFELSPAWTATIAVGTSTTKYLVIPTRTDKFWDASVAVNYAVTTNFSLQASYLYRKNISTLEIVTFDDNLATLTAACRF